MPVNRYAKNRRIIFIYLIYLLITKRFHNMTNRCFIGNFKDVIVCQYMSFYLKTLFALLQMNNRHGLLLSKKKKVG